MNFSFDGFKPFTSSPNTRENNNPATNFNVELGSFLVTLSRTDDLSSLSSQLARLKMAWEEEVKRTEETSGEESEISSIESPRRKTSSDMEMSSSSPGDTSTTSSAYPSTETSPSISREAHSSSKSGVGSGDGSYHLTSRVIKFSVQRGARFDLKKEQLLDVFSKFGTLSWFRLYAKTHVGFDGYLEYVSADVAASLVNSLVKVGDCELHCSLPWESLTSKPVPHQILLESRYLPNVWERDMILRSFFSKYGVVTGVSMIGFTPGKLIRYVVSFKDPNPALDLIGSWVTILSSTVWVREVTSQTVPAPAPVNNSRRPARSDLPWRK